MKNSVSKKTAFAVLIITAVVLTFSGCFNSKLPVTDITIENENGTAVALNVEIADTVETRQHGFMERKKIPEGTGMIFVFDHDQQLNFWMKNTPTALSIAYVDSRGIIRDIYDMVPFSTVGVSSSVSVRYAIEVPKGWYAKNAIKEGCKVNLTGVPAARE